MSLLKVDDLTVTFDEFTAVDSVGFTIEPGETLPPGEVLPAHAQEETRPEAPRGL